MKRTYRTEICVKNSIPNSTLSTILRDREKLQKAREDSKLLLTTKKMKLCSNEELEEAVFLWFRQARAMNVSLSGPVIIGKATEIAVTSPEKWPKTKLAFKPKWIERAPKFRFKVILLYINSLSMN